MYYLNKIIGWVTSPLAVTFLVAVAGLVLARFGRRRLGVWLMGGAVAWLWQGLWYRVGGSGNREDVTGDFNHGIH